MRGITKRFPGVVALRDVSIALKRGEVLALMGENGAGKSTLMKILGGAYQPDQGQISLDDQPVIFHGVADAKRHGIALIHQELMLASNLDIAGNIFLGNEQAARTQATGLVGGSIMRLLPSGRMHRKASELLARVGLAMSPSTPVSRLTAGQMQMVEIAKALALNARIIIMDEPTSSLTLSETRQLFKIINALRGDGIGIIYISHRMEEVMEIADRITVLRDGKYVGDLETRNTTQEKIVSMMVGRPMSAWFPQRPKRAQGEVILEVANLQVLGARAGVSFKAYRGEILGFAGLVGSGRTELMETLFGVRQAIGGTMRLEGKPYQPRSPHDAIEHGLFLAPEDRKKHGLVLPMTIAQNISLPDIGNYRPRFAIQRGKEAAVALQELNRMRIKAPSIRTRVVNLSGGNQQKVVLGKWLAMEPRILMLDEPTRGIDVGAKAEIYRHMANLADQGITIIMVSSDMEEVLGMSDRIAVMYERRLIGIVPRESASQERVAHMMTVGSAEGAVTQSH